MFLTKEEKEQFKINKLKGQTQAVYSTIRDFCYGKKNTCFPSQEKIAERLNCDVRTVARHIKKLCECHMIEKVRRGKMKTNVYILPYKEIGEKVYTMQKKCKENASSCSDKVTGQNRDGETTKYFTITDDYTLVQDTINSYIITYGQDVVGQALARIKGKTISLNGFKTYFNKVIQTIAGYIANQKKYDAIKKTFKKIKEYKFSKGKTNQVSTFNNYGQRNYDFQMLEDCLLGRIPDEIRDTINLSDMVHGTINHEKDKAQLPKHTLEYLEYNKHLLENIENTGIIQNNPDEDEENFYNELFSKYPHLAKNSDIA